MREMHLDEKSHLEDRIEREKNKVEKCKRSRIKLFCRQEEIEVEEARALGLYSSASKLEGQVFRAKGCARRLSRDQPRGLGRYHRSIKTSIDRDSSGQ